MVRRALIMLLFLEYGCSTLNTDCLNDKGFKRFDSALSRGITDDSALNNYINDPRFLVPLRKQLCNHINEYDRITYFETISFLNEGRTGIVYVHDSKQFFSFSQHTYNEKLIFNDEVNKKGFLYKLMIKFKEDFRSNPDSLKNAFKETKVSDAPLIKCVHVVDTSASSFAISYDPVGLLQDKYLALRSREKI